MKLFSYGTLRDFEIQKILFNTTIKMTPAVLQNYDVFSDDDGYFFVCEADGKQINGHILELNEDQMRIADQWECTPPRKSNKGRVPGYSAKRGHAQ